MHQPLATVRSSRSLAAACAQTLAVGLLGLGAVFPAVIGQQRGRRVELDLAWTF